VVNWNSAIHRSLSIAMLLLKVILMELAEIMVEEDRISVEEMITVAVVDKVVEEETIEVVVDKEEAITVTVVDKVVVETGITEVVAVDRTGTLKSVFKSDNKIEKHRKISMLFYLV
jgi:hypothetical protein